MKYYSNINVVHYNYQPCDENTFADSNRSTKLSVLSSKANKFYGSKLDFNNLNIREGLKIESIHKQTIVKKNSSTYFNY